jgi:hypothetical protein
MSFLILIQIVAFLTTANGFDVVAAVDSVNPSPILISELVGRIIILTVRKSCVLWGGGWILGEISHQRSTSVLILLIACNVLHQYLFY